jgi:hypothetical protein
LGGNRQGDDIERKIEANAWTALSWKGILGKSFPRTLRELNPGAREIIKAASRKLERATP